jgi:hypothetical protein
VLAIPVRLLERLRKREPGLVIGSVVFAFHTLIGISHGGPVAVPDVSAYLAVSQWFYGGILPENLAFHPGYGVLLAPFGWLTGEHLHSAALVTNGVLAALCIPLAVRLATAFGANSKTQWVTAVLTAVSPSLSVSSRIAWPETLLVLLLLGTALLIHNRLWDRAGAVAGLAVAVHPRATVLAIALVLLALSDRQKTTKLLQGLLPSLAMTAGLLTVTDTWPLMRIHAATSFGSGPGPIATFMGQWLAFVVATGGIAALGLGVALWSVPRRHRCDAKAFLGVSAVGMFVLGAWTLAGSDRVDTLLYGRYIAPWTLLLAVVGLVTITTSNLGRFACIAILASTIVASIVCIAAASETSEPARRIMTLELGVFWALLNENLVLILISAAVLGCLSILSLRRGAVIPLIFLGLISVSSTWVDHRHLQAVGRVSEGQVTAAKSLPDEAICLAHDISTKRYSMWLYRLELPLIEHQRVNLGTGSVPCGNYVIAGVDALKFCNGAEMIAKEPRASWGLWTYPPKGCG